MTRTATCLMLWSGPCSGHRPTCWTWRCCRAQGRNGHSSICNGDLTPEKRANLATRLTAAAGTCRALPGTCNFRFYPVMPRFIRVFPVYGDSPSVSIIFYRFPFYPSRYPGLAQLVTDCIDPSITIAGCKHTYFCGQGLVTININMFYHSFVSQMLPAYCRILMGQGLIRADEKSMQENEGQLSR